MRFGFNINLKNSSQELRELGSKLLKTGEYQAIEVTYAEHMRHIDTTEFNRELRTLIDLYKPEIAVHIPDFNIAEEDIALQRAIISEFENCCKYTKKLNGNAVIVHCGSNKLLHVSIAHEDGRRQTHQEVFEKLWRLSVETMQELCDIAVRYGITIYTENLSFNKLIQKSGHLNQYIEDVGRDNIAIVFDTGHSHFTGNDVSEEIRKCGKMLKHLHIHDNHGEKDEHLPVGDGTIDWRAFAEAMKSCDYVGIYMMEMYHSNVPALLKCKNELLKYY